MDRNKRPGALSLWKSIKALSCEEYTQLPGLLVHFLRCQNSYVASYATIFPPCCVQKSCAIWVLSITLTSYPPKTSGKPNFLFLPGK